MGPWSWHLGHSSWGGTAPRGHRGYLQNRSLGANPMERGSRLEQGEGGDVERKRPSMSWGRAVVFLLLLLFWVFLLSCKRWCVSSW